MCGAEHGPFDLLQHSTGKPVLLSHTFVIGLRKLADICDRVNGRSASKTAAGNPHLSVLCS